MWLSTFGDVLIRSLGEAVAHVKGEGSAIVHAPLDSPGGAGASAPDAGADGDAHGHESVRLSQMGTGDAWHQRSGRESPSGYRAGDTRGRQVLREPQTLRVNGEGSPAAVQPRAGLAFFEPTADARISGQRRQRSWPLRVCPSTDARRLVFRHRLAKRLVCRIAGLESAVALWAKQPSVLPCVAILRFVSDPAPHPSTVGPRHTLHSGHFAPVAWISSVAYESRASLVRRTRAVSRFAEGTQSASLGRHR